MVEEKERREKEAEVRGENITQEDIDRIKRDITSLKQERKNDREVKGAQQGGQRVEA